MTLRYRDSKQSLKFSLKQLKKLAKKEDIFEIIDRIDASQRAQARILSEIAFLLAEIKSLKFQVRENVRR